MLPALVRQDKPGYPIGEGFAGADPGRCRCFRAEHPNSHACLNKVRRHLPGDDLVGTPIVAGTRAITIDAPPELVWPWLIQQGFGARRLVFLPDR